MTRLFHKIYKHVLYAILRILPILTFPTVNVFIFKRLGYKIHKTVKISSSVKILGELMVTVGHETFIGDETVFTGGKATIIVGSNCDISDKVSFVCGTHEINLDSGRIAGKGISKDIKVGNGVWVGYGATILGGVEIGEMAIIGARCLVNKNVEPFTIVGGVPMKIIKKLK